MGYYNMNSEFDYTTIQPSDNVAETHVSKSSDTSIHSSAVDEKMEMLQKKIDYIKNNGGVNQMFKQNRFSAKFGLIAAGGGFLYAWRAKKNLFWWSLGCGVAGLVVGNLLKDKISFKKPEINNSLKKDNENGND